MNLTYHSANINSAGCKTFTAWQRGLFCFALDYSCSLKITKFFLYFVEQVCVSVAHMRLARWTLLWAQHYYLTFEHLRPLLQSGLDADRNIDCSPCLERESAPTGRQIAVAKRKPHLAEWWNTTLTCWGIWNIHTWVLICPDTHTVANPPPSVSVSS